MLKLAQLAVLFFCTVAHAMDNPQYNAIMEERNRVERTVNLCGIEGNWRKVASLDTTTGEECPEELQTFTDSATGIKACGMLPMVGWRGSCDSVKYPVAGSYTEVCGRMKGYQYGSPEAFEVTRFKLPVPGIDDIYVDGVSVTYGSSPRKHLWTYAAGISENYPGSVYMCPCAKPEEYYYDIIPDFVGEHYYCETGRAPLPGEGFTNLDPNFLWDDPLWDGEGCHTEGNKCCERFGWFHRTIPETSDDIELRICNDHDTAHGNVALEQVEIYVK